MNNPTLNQHPIHPLIQQRWSPRAYDPQRLIEPDTLLSILEAARWSPSSNNNQPWRFILADRHNEVGFRAMLEVLSSSNQRWAKDAGALIMIVTRTQHDDGRVNRYGGHDAGVALAQLTLQAMDHGLFVHPMAGFDADKACDTFAIPANYDPMTVSALGYYGALDQLADDLQQREQRSRERLPLSDLVYESRFGQPAAIVR